MKGFTFGSHDIVGSLLASMPLVHGKEKATAVFETGYPYIGLSESYYDKVAQILTKEVEGMECTKGFHWGICRVPEKRCDRLNLDYNLTFHIDNYHFTIPLKNMAVYVNQTNQFYCQTQIALVKQSEHTIILGGAFFTSFLGIFDVENDRLGLANSARALEGSSITCEGTNCLSFNTISPGYHVTSPLSILVLISVFIIVSILIVICICQVKKRRKLEREK